MGRCLVYGCKSDSEKNKAGISLHRFPSDREIRRKWVKNLQIEDWVATKNSRVCSKHFEEKCFYKTDKKMKIIKNAIPTLLIKPPKYLEYRKKLKETSKATSEYVASIPRIGSKKCISRITNKISQLTDDETSNSEPDMEILVDNLPKSEEECEYITIINDNGPVLNPSDAHQLTEEGPSELLWVVSSDIQNSDDISSSRSSDINLPDSSDSAFDDETNENQTMPSNERLPQSLHECSFDDMDNPVRARRCWSIAQKTICSLKVKVKELQRQHRLANQKVDCMKLLLQFLEDQGYLDDFASSAIKAVIPDTPRTRSLDEAELSSVLLSKVYPNLLV